MLMEQSPFTKSVHGNVTLHLKAKTERNPTIAKLCMCVDENIWTWKRHLKHTGVDPYPEIRRKMTLEEYDRERKYTRLHSYGYKSWIALIRDEWVNTEDFDWCNKIIQLAKLKMSLSEILKPTL